MQKRFIPLLCLFCTIILLIPCTARTFEDNESLKEKVKPSIEAGVEYLKSVQLATGVWVYQGNQGNLNDPHTVGATALVAIALMECGVSPKDRQIQAAYKVVKQAATNPALTSTYTISLCVIFLDRVNRDNPKNHKDVGLIKTLATKLAQGQSAATGGWSYTVPSDGSDNSNTQFAVVALWVARKYNARPGGVMDAALSRAEHKFRNSQQQDGGWGYDTSMAQVGGHSTGSMTCAGILGIALHAGAKRQSQTSFRGDGTGGTGDVVQSLDSDIQVVKARKYLVEALKTIVQYGGDSVGSHTPPYFFWSLERVATLYKWRKLDGVDWFELGAKFLMSKQQRRGNWYFGSEDTGVDTAFSLLFLAKSNLLGTLQETGFTGGGIGGDSPVIPKKKEAETKPQDTKEKAKVLAEKLINALPPQQAEILEALTEGKGSEYTDALTDAISKLSTNASKEAAREALANRLKRMKSNVLGDYMQENDRELRLAAAVAVRLKNDPSAAASLIPLLADQDIGVSTAALDSLKAISGQDFGKSVERWSRWLDTVPKKP